VDAATAAAADASQCDRLQISRQLDPVNRVSYLESRCYMLNTLLRDADFMSMSQGLEVRVPLIDHVLAKAVLALPGAWKLNGTPKKLLVEALGRSLPDEIVHRPKRGFTLPFEHWMRQELRPEIEPVMTAEHISGGPLGGLLDATQVQQVWKDFLRGAVSWTRPWSLYVLQRWCELHL
jgi:asparagine synthase (glutamine-hydrolysing)